jgi:hypothetical protein
MSTRRVELAAGLKPSESILTPKQFSLLQQTPKPQHGRNFYFCVVNGSAWLVPNRLFGATINHEGDAI